MADKKEDAKQPDQVWLDLKIMDGDTGFDLHAKKAVARNTNGLDALRGIVTFTSKPYPQLGPLVLTLCEIAPAPDKEWFLYIDGKKSDVGIGSIRLEKNMLVEWKTE